MKKKSQDVAHAGMYQLQTLQFRAIVKFAMNRRSTAVRIVACSVSLLFVSLAPHFLVMVGAAYAAVAILLGLALTYFGVRIGTERTALAARNLLLASVLYLPALLTIMIVDSR